LHYCNMTIIYMATQYFHLFNHHQNKKQLK
jgi:hypothetical protein